MLQININVYIQASPVLDPDTQHPSLHLEGGGGGGGMLRDGGLELD